MATQKTINKRQATVNDDQVVLNDKTKFDLRFNNIYAIIVSVITVVVFWFMTIGGLKSDIATIKFDQQLTNQKLDTIIKNQEAIAFKYEGVQARLGIVELVNEKIKTLLKIN